MAIVDLVGNCSRWHNWIGTLEVESAPNTDGKLMGVKWDISHSKQIVGLLMLQIAALTVHAYRSSPTHDELGHLFAGLAYLQHGDTRAFMVNPPLVRTLGALPAHFLKIRVERVTGSTLARREFGLGQNLFVRNPERVQLALFIGRLFCSSFTVAATYVLYFCGLRLGKHRAGMFAAAFWAFQPQVIAHGSLITSDIAVASLSLMVTVALMRYCARVSLLRSLGVGLLLGVCISAKFTGLLLVPIVLGVIFWQLDKRSPITLLLDGLVVTASTLFVISLPYDLSTWGKLLDDFQLVSLSGEQLRYEILTVSSWLPPSAQEMVRVPLPEDFVLGIDRQQRDFDFGIISYAAGMLTGHGWWWFYLFSMLVKLPVGTLIATAVTIFLLVTNGKLFSKGMGIPLLVLATVVMVTAVKSGFAQQHRYILPAYPFLFLAIGIVYARATRLPSPFYLWSSRGIVLGLVMTIAGCLYVAPHWLSAFNVLAGGNKSGFKMLFNDASDWGQDTYLVRDWINEHQQGVPIWVQSSVSGANYHLPAVGAGSFIDYSQTDTRLAEVPRPFWLVISKNDYVHGLDCAARLDREPVAEYIGGTYLVYYFAKE